MFGKNQQDLSFRVQRIARFQRRAPEDFYQATT